MGPSTPTCPGQAESPNLQGRPPKVDGTPFSPPEGNTARCDIPTPSKPHQTVGTPGLAGTPNTLGCAGTPGRGTWGSQTSGTEGDNPSFPKAGEAPYLGIVMDLHPPGEGRRTPSFPTGPEGTPRPGVPPLHSQGQWGSPRARTSPAFKGGPLRTDKDLHPTVPQGTPQGRRAEDPPQKGTLWGPLPSTPGARDPHLLPFKGFVSPSAERDPRGQLGTSPPQGRWSHLPLSPPAFLLTWLAGTPGSR